MLILGNPGSHLLYWTDSYESIYFVLGTILRAFPALIYSVLLITLRGRSRYCPPDRDEEAEAHRSCVSWPSSLCGEVAEPGFEPRLADWLWETLATLWAHMTMVKRQGIVLTTHLEQFFPIQHFKYSPQVLGPLFSAWFSWAMSVIHHSSLNM